MDANAYRIPAWIVLDTKPHHPRSPQIAAVGLAFASLGCALFAAGWVVCSSIFSAPDSLSALPLLPALLTAFGAWTLWSRSHARGLRFDLADAFLKLIVIASALVSAATLFAFAHGILYPPPPLNFSFGFGGC